MSYLNLIGCDFGHFPWCKWDTGDGRHRWSGYEDCQQSKKAAHFLLTQLFPELLHYLLVVHRAFSVDRELLVTCNQSRGHCWEREGGHRVKLHRGCNGDLKGPYDTAFLQTSGCFTNFTVIQSQKHQSNRLEEAG